MSRNFGDKFAGLTFTNRLMLDVFLKYLSARAELSDNELAAIERACVEKKYRKHQYLLQEGDVCRFNYFILQWLCPVVFC